MNADSRPGFWKRLWLALVRTIVTGILLAALVAAGYFGFMELQRSFGAVTDRVDSNAREVASVRSEVAARSAEVSEQRRLIDSLQDEAERLDARIGTLREEFAADLESQQEALTALDENVAASISNSEAAISRSQASIDDTAALGTALVALQGDLNDSNNRIDALGGEIDALRSDNEGLAGELNDLNESFAAVEAAAAEVEEMAQTLALYHVWELITRARLRLFENNVGLATNDAQRALQVVEALSAEATEEESADLEILQTRLALAVSNLPGDPISAATDLESAWDELEELLSVRLLPPVVEALETETTPPAAGEEATPVATPAETATPPPTATPAPATTPAPTATPSS